MAQSKQQATWEINSVRLNEHEAMIIFRVTLDSGWHVYSQNVRLKEAAMNFSFTESGKYMLLEGVREDSKAIFRFDPFFRQSINRFEKKASFSQRVRITEGNNILVTGEIQYTVGCDGSHPLKEKLHFSVAVTVKNGKENVAAN